MSRMTTLALVSLLTVGLTAVEPAARATDPFVSDADWNRGASGAVTAPTAASGAAMVQMLLALAVVLGLAWGGAKLVKKIGVRAIMPGRGRHLDVIETVPLGFKRALSVVRLGDHVLVVGQSELGLCHLATLPATALSAAPEAPAAVLAKAAPEGATSAPIDGRFRAALAAVLGRRPPPASGAAEDPTVEGGTR